jgi:hypothetical protein
MFARMKDMAVAMAAKVWLTPYVEEFGEIQSIEVDSESRRLTAVLLLKGEEEPVRLTVGGITLLGEGADSRLVLKHFSASKEWVAVLANRYLADRPFRVSEKVGTALQQIF